MLKHASELQHLPVCICTKNHITGYVLDYDCGTTLDHLRTLEQEAEHRRAVAACAIGQPDRAQAVADRESAEARLRRARTMAGYPTQG